MGLFLEKGEEDGKEVCYVGLESEAPNHRVYLTEEEYEAIGNVMDWPKQE